MFRFLFALSVIAAGWSQSFAAEYWIPESPNSPRQPATSPIGHHHHWHTPTPSPAPRNCRQVIVITPARREIGPWRHVGYWPDGEPLYQRTIREWPETRELKWLCDREIGNPVHILDE